MLGQDGEQPFPIEGEVLSDLDPERLEVRLAVRRVGDAAQAGDVGERPP